MEDSNIPVLRLSELYLIAAEAAAKLNNNDKAVKYLDAIVSRANPEKTVPNLFCLKSFVRVIGIADSFLILFKIFLIAVLQG